MFDFSSIFKKLAIPEGNVVIISRDGELVWEKKKLSTPSVVISGGILQITDTSGKAEWFDILVGGEVMATIAVEQTPVEPETYTIDAGTYVFNENPNVQDAVYGRRKFIFVSNGEQIYDIMISSNAIQYDDEQIPTDSGFFNAYNSAGGWSNEAYRTIQVTETQEVSKEFYDWFMANIEETCTLSGTWTFHDNVELPQLHSFDNEEIHFTTVDGTSYSHVYIRNKEIRYTNDETFVDAYDTNIFAEIQGWQNPEFQTITFNGTQTVSKEFYEWFMANTIHIIIFTIDDAAYQAYSEMTWEEWVNSEFNTEGFIVDGDGVYSSIDNPVRDDGNEISKLQTIEDNKEYKSLLIHDYLTFTFINNDTEYEVSGYKGKPVDIEIPSVWNNIPVTSIGACAFAHCEFIKRVEIPNSITNINRWAFYGCKLLTYIVLPQKVTNIGEKAFFNCTLLQTIIIPMSVITIESDAFGGCTSLTILTDTTSKPSGWDSNWNPDNRPVVYSYYDEPSYTYMIPVGSCWRFKEKPTFPTNSITQAISYRYVVNGSTAYQNYLSVTSSVIGFGPNTTTDYRMYWGGRWDPYYADDRYIYITADSAVSGEFYKWLVNNTYRVY